MHRRQQQSNQWQQRQQLIKKEEGEDGNKVETVIGQPQLSMLSSRRTGDLSATKSRSSLDSQKCYQSRRMGRINWVCFVLFSAFTTVVDVDSAQSCLYRTPQQHSQNKTPTLGKHLIFADSVGAGLNCYQIMIPHPTPMVLFAQSTYIIYIRVHLQCTIV